jgi:DNA-binding winged helix-turn-helix (wHTH) protein
MHCAPRVQSEQRVVFGEFELDEAAVSLSRLGAPVEIRTKPLALLAHLVRNRDRVVSKAELLDTVWSDVCVSDQALWSAVRDLRRSLETACSDRMIQTVRGRGFRFVAEVSSAEPRAPVCRTCGAELAPFPQNFPKSDGAGRRSNG